MYPKVNYFTYLNLVHESVKCDLPLDNRNLIEFIKFDAKRNIYPKSLIDSYELFKTNKPSHTIDNNAQITVFFDVTRLFVSNSYSGISITVWKIFNLINSVNNIKVIPVFNPDYYSCDLHECYLTYVNNKSLKCINYKKIDYFKYEGIKIYHTGYYPIPDDLPVYLKKIITVYDILHLTEKRFYPDPSKFVTLDIAKSCLNADFVFSISQYTANQLCSFLHYNPKIIITPLASSLDILEDNLFVKKTEHILTFSYQGGDPRKGFQNMLDVADDWLKKGKDNKVNIFGNLHNLVEKYGFHPAIKSSQTSFINKPNKQELRQIYNSSSVFLYLSEAEGFGLPPLEAMLFGVPAVMLNNTSLSEIFLGWPGLLDSNYSKDKVLNKIYSLIDNPEISKISVDFAKKYSWNLTLESIVIGYCMARR